MQADIERRQQDVAKRFKTGHKALTTKQKRERDRLRTLQVKGEVVTGVSKLFTIYETSLRDRHMPLVYSMVINSYRCASHIRRDFVDCFDVTNRNADILASSKHITDTIYETTERP